jgi:hypothetical protein
LVWSAAFAATALLPVATSANAPPGHFIVGTGAAANTVYDTSTKLTWQRGASASMYSWPDSLNVCSALQSNGGGWRQPTMSELSTLIDFEAAAPPFIDTVAFPGTPTDYFWSKTQSVVPGQAHAITFATGFGNTFGTSMSGYVKCVR